MFAYLTVHTYFPHACKWRSAHGKGQHSQVWKTFPRSLHLKIQNYRWVEILLKWKYKAGINGCCIGGTAIVDHEVLKKSYPNRIISCKSNDDEALSNGADTITIEWDVYKLIKHNT